MPLQQQAGGLQDIFVVVHHQNAGVGGSHRISLFGNGQVSAEVYADGQGVANPFT
jgi:predicted acetyltransferase